VALGATPPLTGDAAFRCQQAAEKALKAFLAWHDVPFRKTHDLAEISQQCVALDVTLEPVCRRAERLTTFAWIFRYPGDPDEPAAEEAAEALAWARDVYAAVLALASNCCEPDAGPAAAQPPRAARARATSSERFW
jgi:HEPN domain-containing protein